MISLQSIDHTCLQVSSLQKTQSYLETIFDFTFFPHPNCECALAVESPTVHFFLEKSVWPKEYMCKQHISLSVENIVNVKSRLDSLDITYTSGTFNGFTYNNYHWVEWADHDGIRWECVEVIKSSIFP
jgi:hypothetical protein